jgi:rRNA maturation endonuclease Nob1
MADDVDLAQTEIDWAQKMTVLAAAKHSTYLHPRGFCHHCEQELTEIDRLFCDADCGHDYERVNWAKRMANR